MNPSASKAASDPGRGLADQLLLRAHTCVLQNNCTKKSIEDFEHLTTLADQVLLWLHPRVKGWRTNCCCGYTNVCFSIDQLRVTTNCYCEHTHVWCRISQLKLLYILKILAGQLLLRAHTHTLTHTCECCRRSQLRAGQPITAVSTHMCVAE